MQLVVVSSQLILILKVLLADFSSSAKVKIFFKLSMR